MVSTPPDLLENREAIRQVLRVRPVGLFLDIDGTLAPLRSDPAAVTITPEVQQAIASLAERMEVVVLSGRTTADSRRIVGIDGVTYVGNHGSQWLRDGQESVLPAAREFEPRIHEIAADAMVRFADLQGIFVQDKGPSMSIHYRNVADRPAAAAAIDKFIDEHPAAVGLRRSDGKLVKEVRPPIDIHKGTAVASVVDERGLRAVVMVGDDITDVDAFRAITVMRDAGRVEGLSIGVLSAGTPDEVLESADYSLADTGAVERLLVWVAGLGGQG
jgi:trehalose 6-phosphate phosphatase